MPPSPAPSCRTLRPEDAEALADFFVRLAAADIARFFHPHPFTREEAARIAGHGGKDVYCALWLGPRIAGYGMLRGWDAGYAIPSLGLAVDPGSQGSGLGRLLMVHLHGEARARGARRVRLKVYPANAAALALYRSLGYEFAGEENGQLVGLVALEKAGAAVPRR